MLELKVRLLGILCAHRSWGALQLVSQGVHEDLASFRDMIRA